MVIETRANIGDLIYYMYDNRVCSSHVRRICIEITDVIESKSNTRVIHCEYITHHGTYEEEKIFLSKRSLVESLMDEE